LLRLRSSAARTLDCSHSLASAGIRYRWYRYPVELRLSCASMSAASYFFSENSRACAGRASRSSSFPSNRWCACLADRHNANPIAENHTKDKASIDIATVAYYHIKAVIATENVYNAINQISQTTVRNVVGRFSLDQLLSDTASINVQIKNVIDGYRYRIQHRNSLGAYPGRMTIHPLARCWLDRGRCPGVRSNL
jgi:hypothetical protein